VNRVALSPVGLRLRLLALGAHCDDIEIGAGGTILRLVAEHRDLDVRWVVFCSTPERAKEARAAAAAFLEGAAGNVSVTVMDFRDGFLPYAGTAVKEAFEEIKSEFDPTMILTHARDDRHQDHRIVSDLTWNTWRDHLVLEYEVPKYDGDFGSPNVFFQLTAEELDRKVDLLVKHFPSQRTRQWFTRDLFQAVARIRGMESAAPGGFAEGFTVRKLAV